MNRPYAFAAALSLVTLATVATDDPGIFVTGVAGAAAFVFGRGVWIRHLLAMAWAMVTIEALLGATKDAVVFSIAMVDLIIAGAALIRWLEDDSRVDARIIGGISIALMPAHFIMSASEGAVSWWLYASICNAAFVLQCLIIGGWLDHVGRSTGRFFARLNPVHLFRRGDR
jgi:hypothetical protein